MAVLTSVRDTNEIASGARTLVLPVKAASKIYQGSLVALDAGYAIPGKKSVGLTAAGRAEETVDNRDGADGAVTVRVSRGVFVWDNTATAANKLTAAQLLKPCYMEDDQTVTALATGASVAGLVVGVTDGGVAVEICPAFPASGA